MTNLLFEGIDKLGAVRVPLQNRGSLFASLETPAIVAVAFLAVGGASGCASGGANLEQPFQPPSFEAKVYENAEMGFSLHYPAGFIEQDGPLELTPGASELLQEADFLFLAASPLPLPTSASFCTRRTRRSFH